MRGDDSATGAHRVGAFRAAAFGVVALGAILSLGACSHPPPKPDAFVTVDNLRFAPMEVHIPVGGTVEWDFTDGVLLHQVYADGIFDSGVHGSGSYRHTFTSRGDIDYHCQIHPDMTGIIHVG
ncbi:cupredoxin domain-containing protein [Gordonia sp. DT30]|uniref:cupredoxin domain-containing protein n=1 Tax=unclassified Gordonia (in: high G+C Gram-positive bacteria) TaxID=2657482 RepID=UPI003CF37D6D